MSERDKVPRWVLWLGVSLAVGWLLFTLRGVLAPVFFAFLIAYMLDPLVDRIEESRLLRGSSIGRAVGIAVLLARRLRHHRRFASSSSCRWSTKRSPAS